MMSNSRIYGRTFLVVTTSAYVLLVVPFHIRPDNFIVDDGYFYLQIARNIASGYGSTFNRVMPTNGYHPLWMLVCVFAATCVKSNPHLIQAVAAISDALILLSIYLFIHICQISRKQGASAGIVVITFMTTTLGIWRMLEADLSFALQLAILSLIAQWHSRRQTLTIRHALSMGCLLGLALLARLDLVFFVFIVFAYTVLGFTRASPSNRSGSWAIKTLAMGALICLIVGPYLYWNYREFGHIVPISGAIKSVFLAHFYLPAYCIPVILACCLNFARFGRAPDSPFATVALIASGAALIHLVYSLLFGNVAAWYLTTGYLSVALCATWLLDASLSRSRSPGRLVAWSSGVAFFVLGALGTLRLLSNFTYTRLKQGNVKFGGNYTEPKRALAERLRQILPQGSRIYVYDGPGGVAYYSGMSIIPTDGLVNDYSYNSKLLRDGVVRYMAEERIDYIIAPFLREGQVYSNADLDSRGIFGGQQIEIFSPLHHRSAGTFVVPDRDMLATFATIVPDMERSAPEIALWRVNH